MERVGGCTASGGNITSEIDLTTSQAGASFVSGPQPSTNLGTGQHGVLISNQQLATAANLSSVGGVSMLGPDGTVLTGTLFAGTNVEATTCVLGGTLLP